MVGLLGDGGTGAQVKLTKTQQKERGKTIVVVGHYDIKDAFWDRRPWILPER